MERKNKADGRRRKSYGESMAESSIGPGHGCSDPEFLRNNYGTRDYSSVDQAEKRVNQLHLISRESIT